MKIQIGQDYMVIDGMLYDFTSYRDMNVYAVLSVINSIDDSRFPGEASKRSNAEVVTDEKIFETPYGRTILNILYAYYNFTDTKVVGDEYKQLRKILGKLED